MVVFRIFLGLSLFIKGIQFIQNKSILQKIVEENNTLQEYFWLQTIIPWVHLLGGVFILIGMFTRPAVIVQLPILIGAVFFVNSKKWVFAGESELGLSIVILLLLIVFLFAGDGYLSWRKMIRRENNIE
jgi:uncharacterized membrane protein YphA (DoxX/SURF4 family)